MGNIIGGAQSVQTGGGCWGRGQLSPQSYNYYMNLNGEVAFTEPTNGPSAYYYPSLAEMSEEFDEHLSNYSKGLAFAISYEEGRPLSVSELSCLTLSQEGFLMGHFR